MSKFVIISDRYGSFGSTNFIILFPSTLLPKIGITFLKNLLFFAFLSKVMHKFLFILPQSKLICLKFLNFDLCIMPLVGSLLMKLEWFPRKYLVFKGACKFRASRTIFLKAKKSLGEIFCIINVFLISFQNC